MKLAIITWITYNNFGTQLQAFALQRYLEDKGFQTEIVSDEFIVLKPKKTQSDNSRRDLSQYLFHPLKLYKRVTRIKRDIKNRFISRIMNQSQDCYKSFKNKYLQIRYGVTDKEEISSEYDVFVCGSDQIWNTFEYNFNGYYYLDFTSKLKISYAPSIGTDEIDPKKMNTIKKWLHDYTAISVREKMTAEALSKTLDREVKWVCDPTMLFENDFWSHLVTGKRLIKNGYLLCYFLEDKKWYYVLAKRIAKEKHLKLVIIPNKRSFFKYREIWKHGCGPLEFINLVRNAEYILTDSYHGSIFSLLFNKEFRYLLRFNDNDAISQNIRVYSLFEYLEINDLIVREGTNLSMQSMEKKINYELINKRMDDYRNWSREYLDNSIKYE